MSEYIISLNKRKINAIDAPADAEVEIGDDLVLKLVNHGSPLHVTVKAVDARRYTLYPYENIYLQEDMEFVIPILSTAPAGEFIVEIITGYGTVKKSFPVTVKEKKFVMPENPEDIPEEPDRRSYGYPAAVSLLLIAGWAVYIAGVKYYGEPAGFAAVIILTMAAVVAWFWRP